MLPSTELAQEKVAKSSGKKERCLKLFSESMNIRNVLSRTVSHNCYQLLIKLKLVVAPVDCLTLTHPICKGANEKNRLLPGRQAGSIAAFLAEYLKQITQYDYANAPLEIDARIYEAQ